MLEVSIGYKTHCSIECQIAGHGWIGIRIEREPTHICKHQHRNDEPNDINSKQSNKMSLPCHFFGYIYSAKFIKKVIQRRQYFIQPCLFIAEYFGDVPAKRYGQ